MEVQTAIKQAQEMERQAQIERERKLDIAVSYREAVALVRPGTTISWALQARLKRTGALISPSDLERQIREWRRCPECGDKGLLGNAIDRDLRFCTCMAGEEARHRYGENWPEKEIPRVHADVRARATRRSLPRIEDGMADAIRHSEFIDRSSKLEVKVTLHAPSSGSDGGEVRGLAGELSEYSLSWVSTPCCQHTGTLAAWASVLVLSRRTRYLGEIAHSKRRPSLL
jgi:hypothetical protein